MKPCGSDDREVKVRPAAKAGSWYESNPEALKRTLQKYFDKAAQGPMEEPVRALISPHAGYVYSGPTAAVGYSTLKEMRIRRVIVLAPSHYSHFNGGSIADVTHYETPLGRIPLDREACDALLKLEVFTTAPSAHAREHSLELQLPFLQRVLKDGFSLIPILFSEMSRPMYEAVANALLPYWNDETLVVASSDFTHYGPSFGYVPFRDKIPQNLKKLDIGAVEKILALDQDGFLDYVEETGATICGRKPIGVLLSMAKKRKVKSKLLKYTTSGEIMGDYSSSVSYASLCFTGGEFKAEEGLTEGEKDTLIRLARFTLKTLLETGKGPKDLSGFQITKRLQENLGAFVTLKKKGQLRGCIGYLTGRGPLYKTVIANTINAASEDPRFPKVRLEEEPGLHIEISVLSPVVRVKDIKEIQVGRDGLIISRGFYRGTLLPQVPVENNWNLEEFLKYTCRKAGLPLDAYKDPETKIERYSAQVFSEPK